MPKRYTAQSVVPINSINLSVDNNGNITTWVLNGDVNYGERGMSESLDIWPLLNVTQKQKLQVLYTKMGQLFSSKFLG